MAEQTQERPAIYLTLLGERHELVLPGFGWTYAEAKLAKAVSDGMAPVEIGQAFLAADPDAVMAIIRVTLHRAKRQLTTADLEELSTIDLEHVAEAAMAGFRALSDNLAGGNGATPTVPAKAGEQTNPVGLSTSAEPDSQEPNSESSDGSETDESSEQTEKQASGIVGHLTSAAS